MVFLKRFKDLSRLREILQVLVRHGFGHLVEQIRLYRYLSWSASLFPRRSKTDLPLGQRMKNLFEELGPTFIKLGQILSTRMDLFPEEVIETLSQLQDDVLHVEFDKIEERLKREFERPLSEIFQDFNEEPLAAASIAQVHRAVLVTGEEVVVKVKRPGIEKSASRDLNILETLIAMVEERVTYLKPYNVSGIFQEFSRSLRREMDFEMEARNIVRFSRNLSEYPWVRIPKVFLNYATPNVLIMEHLKGEKVTQYQGSPEEKKALAKKGAKAIFHQVFIDGLFHGDPHPGNIFILEKGGIGFVDFGLTGRLDTRMEQNLKSLMEGVVSRDSEKLAESILKICRYEGEEIVREEFERDLIDILDSFYGLPMKYIRFYPILSQLFSLARRYELYVPTEYTLIIKSLLTIENIASELDPDFHLMDSLKTFLEEEVFSSRTKSGAERVKKALTGAAETFEVLPSQLKNVLDKLEKGKVRLEFKQRGLEFLHKELEKASKRISGALILCSLIIGSALIITSPHRGEYSILGYDALGVLGFFIAGSLGVILTLSSK